MHRPQSGLSAPKLTHSHRARRRPDEEIPALVEHFSHEVAERHGVPAKRFGPEVSCSAGGEQVVSKEYPEEQQDADRNAHHIQDQVSDAPTFLPSIVGHERVSLPRFSASAAPCSACEPTAPLPLPREPAVRVCAWLVPDFP